MKKKDITILTMVLALPIITPFILPVVFKYNLCQSEWITLITASISTFATIFLGYMVFFQTENHKKRQEEDNKLYQAQAEINRKQDLMLRANPHAIFTNIDCLNYAQCPMMISKGEIYNRLTNIAFENSHIFPEHVYMDINFNVPPNNVLEQVRINEVKITCYTGELMDSTSEEIANFSLLNYSSNEKITNIKISESGKIVALLSLLFDIKSKAVFFQNDIKKLLDDTNIKWRITIFYTLSNSFNVNIDYKTHMDCTLSNGVKDVYGHISYTIQDPKIITTQTSSIRID
jgi:hypothetical protein